MQTLVPTRVSVRVPIDAALKLYGEAKANGSGFLTHIAERVSRQIEPAGIELKLHQSQTHLQIALRFDELQAQQLQAKAALEGCSAYDWMESQLLSVGTSALPEREKGTWITGS